MSGNHEPTGIRHLLTAVAVCGLTVGVGLELNGFLVETAIAGLVWLVLALVGAAFFLRGAAKRQRDVTLRGVVILGALVGGIMVSAAIGDAQIRASKERGDRVASGLSAFHEAEGTYPATLQALVPGQLSAIPPTAMSLFRRQSFSYERRNASYELRFNGRDGTGFRRGPDTAWTWFD